MKLLFPYSALGSLNPRIDRSECLKVTEITEKRTKRNNKLYKLIKFQAVKVDLNNIVECEYDLFGFKMIWEETNVVKNKKGRPLFYDDFEYYQHTGIILKETWIWNAIGISKISTKIQGFNLAITDSHIAEHVARRHLYYLGYDLVNDDGVISKHEPYNPNDFSWANEL